MKPTRLPSLPRRALPRGYAGVRYRVPLRRRAGRAAVVLLAALVDGLQTILRLLAGH